MINKFCDWMDVNGGGVLAVAIYFVALSDVLKPFSLWLGTLSGFLFARWLYKEE